MLVISWWDQIFLSYMFQEEVVSNWNSNMGEQWALGKSKFYLNVCYEQIDSAIIHFFDSRKDIIYTHFLREFCVTP